MSMYWRKGEDELEEGADFATYRIDRIGGRHHFSHKGQIEVYGSEQLRDLIIELLNKDERSAHVS